MPLDTSFALVLAAIGPLVVLGLLLLAKRVARSTSERRSRRRRVRWVAAIGTGPVLEMRMGELRALARETRRSASAQEDLLSLLAAGRLPPSPERRGPFEAELRRGGLLRALRRACGSRSAAVRGRAALIWSKLGLAGAERVIGPLMSDPDPDVRAAATQALAWCESEEAVWILLRSLRDAHVEPARIAERLAGAWAVGPLLAALREHDFEPVRPWLVEGLGLTGDPRAEAPLVTLLASERAEERIRACRALGRVGRRSSAPAVIAALGDPSATVRAQAAQALAQLRDPRAVDPLVRLLGDSSWWARARAAEALLAIGGPGVRALRRCAEEHTDRFARERAAEALGRRDLCEHELVAA